MNIEQNFESSSQDKDSIEEQVNFESNDTELLLNRLRDPTIKRQMVDAHYQAEMKRYRFFREEEWGSYNREEESDFDLLQGKESGEIISQEDLQALLEEPEPSREEILKEIEERIENTAASTDIEYSSKSPTAGEALPLEWTAPWSGEKPTPKQMSIIEAHEKGHEIRHYNELTDKFLQGFDISNVEFTEEFAEMRERERRQNPDMEEEYEDTVDGLSLEEQREGYLHNYLFTGDEIVERMSQLKNYFGMDGSDTFTKEHLHYAKENYIEDTGMDNAMNLFFQGITEDTEDEFIELINSMGV